MNIDCKYCLQPIVDECVSATSTAITCPGCNMVADYRWQLEPALDEEVAAAQMQRRAPPALPMGWELQQVALPAKPGGAYRSKATGPALLLSRRWSNPRKLSLLWFAAFMLLGLLALFSQLELWKPMVVCMLAMLAIVGVLKVNRTTLSVEGDWLKIRHAPVPWLGHHKMSRVELKEVFCRRYLGLDGETLCYEVGVLLLDREQRLMGELESAEEALYIKQLITTAWHLDEQAVDALPLQSMETDIES